MQQTLSCGDLSGGGGVQAQLTEKTSEVFFIPQLILQFYRGGPMVYFKENYNFLRFQGVQHFPGGSKFFQGGSKC